ncbi:hypothetical protein ACOSQ2_026582 [Xanthoceras sorbifolium]
MLSISGPHTVSSSLESPTQSTTLARTRSRCRRHCEIITTADWKSSGSYQALKFPIPKIGGSMQLKSSR